MCNCLNTPFMWRFKNIRNYPSFFSWFTIFTFHQDLSLKWRGNCGKLSIILILGIASGLLFKPLSARSQIIFQKPLSARTANYAIEASLDVKSKTIVGREKLIWKNASDSPVTELQFHLYMNAFRNMNSTFSSKPGRMHGRFRDLGAARFGSIDIDQMILNENENLMSSIEFIQPDDGNVNDSTVIRVLLPIIVPPNTEISLDIAFRVKLPEMIARTGYSHNFFLIAQWFPKIGVLKDGQWNCHQFHANSEFFADFGIYEVIFRLPLKYVVGATGVLLKEEVDDSIKTLHFRAEDVHDFALTAWPKFKQKQFEKNDTKVKILFAPEHTGQIDRYIESISATMDYLGNWLEPYPYPNLTLVDVPLFAGRASGMEYPCFITGTSIWGLPSYFRFLPEETIVHEFAHQYFYGILASNEFEEAWLDEGFASFAAFKALSDKYGFHSSSSTLFNIMVGQYDSHKKYYLRNPDSDITLKPSWDFSRRNYGVYVYDKPVLILQTLENLIGKDLMDRVMKAYLKRWRFKHPTTQDFIDIVNDLSTENMDWFFEQALQDTATLDFRVETLTNSPLKHIWSDSLNEHLTLYESCVTISKRGSFICPVGIAFIFENGDTLTEIWDGKESEKLYTFTGKQRLLTTIVDPEQKLWLDLNWSNNSLTEAENRTAFYRHWLKSIKILQQILYTLWTF